MADVTPEDFINGELIAITSYVSEEAVADDFRSIRTVQLGHLERIADASGVVVHLDVGPSEDPRMGPLAQVQSGIYLRDPGQMLALLVAKLPAVLAKIPTERLQILARDLQDLHVGLDKELEQR